ncbi:MAG: hypothetical protein AMXMBFR33_01610 [Candidatus Xenobia bacterium]
MSALHDRWPHLGLQSQPQIKPEHLCPHCGEAILEQLTDARALGVYTAEGWWRCPRCNHQCSDRALVPQTSQAEIDQCRKEDEHRGQPGGGSSSAKRRAKPLPKPERDPMQEASYGGRERIARPTSVVSVRLDDDETAIAEAIAQACRVSRSVVIRWALEHGWAGLRQAGWCAGCQELCLTKRCIACGGDPAPFGATIGVEDTE